MLISRRKDRPGTLGFTLIELMVVIAIIAVLAGLIGTVTAGVMERSRLAEVHEVLHELRLGMEKYRHLNDFYPMPDDAQPDGGYLVFKRDGTGCLDCLLNEDCFSFVRNPSGLDDKQRLSDPWEQPYRYHYDDQRDGQQTRPVEDPNWNQRQDDCFAYIWSTGLTPADPASWIYLKDSD